LRTTKRKLSFRPLSLLSFDARQTTYFASAILIIARENESLAEALLQMWDHRFTPPASRRPGRQSHRR
jgi:hypothetical protein